MKMPEGYYPLRESGHWCVVRDDNSPFVKRLRDKDGEDKRFASELQATEYAQRHADLKLEYNQEV